MHIWLLLPDAGFRVWRAQHSVLSPSTQGGFLSGVLKVTKGKWEIKHSQRDNGDKPSAKWLMWYLDIQLKSSHTPRAISLSLWSRKTENTLFISPITDRRGWDGPSGPAISKEVCCSRRGRRVSSFPPAPGKSRTSMIAQMQVQKPTEHEATCRERIFLQGRVTEGEDIQLHCHHGGPSWKPYEVRKDKVPCCQENHLWNPACPKDGEPSQSQQDPLTITSGHLGTWHPTQQTSAPFSQT